MPEGQIATIHPITGELDGKPVSPRQATMQGVMQGLSLADASQTPEGYSSRINVEWTDVERVGLGTWLRGLADDLISGAATITTARYAFYHKLGQDFDGVKANLDSGDRTFEIVYHRPGDKQI